MILMVVGGLVYEKAVGFTVLPCVNSLIQKTEPVTRLVRVRPTENESARCRMFLRDIARRTEGTTGEMGFRKNMGWFYAVGWDWSTGISDTVKEIVQKHVLVKPVSF
jgi:hypothetical protein